MLNKSQFQNLAELQLQNLDQPLCSKSEKSLVLRPNVSSQICNKLLPTWSSLSTSATVTTSTSFELASSHARATSIKFTKQQSVSQWVSQWVSYWQAFPMIGLGSDKNGNLSATENKIALETAIWDAWRAVWSVLHKMGGERHRFCYSQFDRSFKLSVCESFMKCGIRSFIGSKINTPIGECCHSSCNVAKLQNEVSKR